MLKISGKFHYLVQFYTSNREGSYGNLDTFWNRPDWIEHMDLVSNCDPCIRLLCWLVYNILNVSHGDKPIRK